MSDSIPRKRLKAPERRASILAAAREVFLETGLAGARTRDLADAAGINQAVLYSHFESKEVLFQAAVVETLEELVAGLVERSKTTREQSDDPEAEFAELNEYVLKQMQEIVPLLGVALFSEQAAGKALYQERIHPLLQEWTRLSERSLGRLPRERSLDSDFIFKAFFGMMFMFTLDSQFRETELDIEAVANGVKELMMHGITAPPDAPAKRTTRPRKK